MSAGKGSLLAQSVSTLLEAEESSQARFVDLCISLRTHSKRCAAVKSGGKERCNCLTVGGDEEIIRVGGRWDRRSKRYTGDAESMRILRVHKGQERAARWFAEWMRRFKSGNWKGFRRVWSALFFGGRRGGKSRFAVWAICMFVVAFPRRQAWCISPTQEETDELEVAIRETLPKSWFRWRGDPKWEFRLPTGARIRLVSGHKPSSLKRGRVDIALYNEGQLMQQKGFTQLRGATSDIGSLTIVAANPPDTKMGRWVEEMHDKAQARKIKCELFAFSPKENPFIEYESLADLADEVDDATFRREVLGELVPIGDLVFYGWSDTENSGPVPVDAVDLTREFCKRHLGRAFDHIVGADFQRSPHMAAVVIKALVPREIYEAKLAELEAAEKRRTRTSDLEQKVREALLDEIEFWVVDEIVVENADEDGLIDGLEGEGRAEGNLCPCCEGADGYNPETTAVIADASGEWQDADRTKGRGSFDWFRKRKWRWLFKPDARMERNPEIGERVKVGNALVKTRSGRRRLRVSERCTRTIRALRCWENKNGAPHRKSEFAHICDAVTYPGWRFWPRRRERSSDDIGVKVRKRPQRGDPWGSPRRPGRRGRRNRVIG